MPTEVKLSLVKGLTSHTIKATNPTTGHTVFEVEVSAAAGMGFLMGKEVTGTFKSGQLPLTQPTINPPR